MAHQSLAMSADATSATPSERKSLDEAVAAVKGKAREWARLPARTKAALVRECIPRVVDAASAWVAEGNKAKGLPPDSGEEWLSGPTPTVRLMRLFAESLDQIAAHGQPALGRGTRTRPDGRLEIDLFPVSGIDKIAFSGFSAHALMQEGVDERAAQRRQAAFYRERDPEGGASLILGAGNVSSIPPMDVLSKLVAEGYVCILKMNPVNEWVGPLLERVLSPFISRGYLRIVYGGGDVGKYLVEHPDVDDVHITGSDRTHDLIAWGPPGPERERRMAEGTPLLQKPISSELGNVSPVAIVPAAYSESELWFQARNVVSMVTNNGSFNCNAAKILVTSKGWGQRERFLDLVARGLAESPTRRAYYPGARDRYETLVGKRPGVERYGEPTPDKLAWAFVRGVDSGNRDERLFQVEPFCGILSETVLDASDPVEFLGAATSFMNDRLWGTLNAAIVIHHKLEKDSTVAAALDRSIVDLRYGTVAINHWPALGYAFGTTPWGGHPSASLRDIQSGLGWVHNSFLLDGIDKAVIRGPLVVKPHPAWFYDNPRAVAIGPRLVGLEASPSWLKLPGLIARAIL